MTDRERAEAFLWKLPGIDPHDDEAWLTDRIAAEFASIREPLERRIATLEAERDALRVAAIKARNALDGIMGDTDLDDDNSVEMDAMRHLSAALSGAGDADHDERVRAEEREAVGRLSVVTFARVMESRLRANDHKGGWDSERLPYLFKRLDEELEELREATTTLTCADDDAEHIQHEAADVANFAMMIAEVAAAIRERGKE